MAFSTVIACFLCGIYNFVLYAVFIEKILCKSFNNCFWIFYDLDTFGIGIYELIWKRRSSFIFFKSWDFLFLMQGTEYRQVLKIELGGQSGTPFLSSFYFADLKILRKISQNPFEKYIILFISDIFLMLYFMCNDYIKQLFWMSTKWR